jgi:hypothetical protein
LCTSTVPATPRRPTAALDLRAQSSGGVVRDQAAWHSGQEVGGMVGPGR